MIGKAIFKFNSGLAAILCSKCRVIIKIGKNFTDEETMAFKGEIELEAQFCKKCKLQK